MKQLIGSSHNLKPSLKIRHNYKDETVARVLKNIYNEKLIEGMFILISSVLAKI